MNGGFCALTSATNHFMVYEDDLRTTRPPYRKNYIHVSYSKEPALQPGTYPYGRGLAGTEPYQSSLRLRVLPTKPTFKGATVAERLACSLPTKANRVQSPECPTPDFRMWESCRTMPLVGGSSRESPASSALSFRCCCILTSISLIGSQDLDVKCRERGVGRAENSSSHIEMCRGCVFGRVVLCWSGLCDSGISPVTWQPKAKYAELGRDIPPPPPQTFSAQVPPTPLPSVTPLPRQVNHPTPPPPFPGLGYARRSWLPESRCNPPSYPLSPCSSQGPAIDGGGWSPAGLLSSIECNTPLVATKQWQEKRRRDGIGGGRTQDHDGNTARLARRSVDALGVRVRVARIAPSLLDLGSTGHRVDPSLAGPADLVFLLHPPTPSADIFPSRGRRDEAHGNWEKYRIEQAMRARTHFTHRPLQLTSHHVGKVVPRSLPPNERSQTSVHDQLRVRTTRLHENNAMSSLWSIGFYCVRRDAPEMRQVFGEAEHGETPKMCWNLFIYFRAKYLTAPTEGRRPDTSHQDPSANGP
ncbi:hypothetical protein PR048_026257 [Dryococelus australis]|uniref:Uncharacterized protein n=1 Tax=Dryococelus australis TaxID=614101 RepID=A0ABQ9GKW3_9NEOP|nr:hypothetical protein PR048_026257 [Dryococelus australis]